MNKLKTMLNPKTTALIGATEKAGAVGRTILQNLLRSGAGKVFPVNPNRKKVLDVNSYQDIPNTLISQSSPRRPAPCPA